MLPSKRCGAVKHSYRKTHNHCFFSIQAQQSESGSTPHLFEEDETYWEPATDTCGLIRQLSSKKYREMVKSQIRYK